MITQNEWKNKRRNIVSSSALVTAVAIVVIFLLALSPLFMQSTAAYSSSSSNMRVITVYPNGHNDTKDIQNALNQGSMGSPVTVQLEKGTYYIDQIAVYGFRGNFVGMGQGLTIIQALPNLPSPNPAYNTPTIPFWAGLPGPHDPWPAMFTFEGGSYSITGMTLTDPYTAPTMGWNDLGTPYTALVAAIEITGLKASATIDHVTVLGASGDSSGQNMLNGINYEVSRLPKGWTNALTQIIPLSGTYSVTNSVFNSSNSGPWSDTLLSATVMVCHNTITNSIVATGFYDAYNSKLTYCGNQISNVIDGVGILAEEDAYEPGTLPSTVYITNNQVLQVSEGANGVILADFNTVSTLNAVVSGNVLQTNTSCGCYTAEFPVILSQDLKSVVVSGNTILDGGTGVFVLGDPGQVSDNTIDGTIIGVLLGSTFPDIGTFAANGVHVTHNLVKNSGQYGIAVVGGSSNNIIAENTVKNSGQFDLYWDGAGAGNHWFDNHYKTSSPPGLG